MASLSAVLQCFDLVSVLRVSDSTNRVLVDGIGNHFLSGRDVALESVQSLEFSWPLLDMLSTNGAISGSGER